MPKRYNTPHRSRVVKTRLSEDDTPTSQRGLRPMVQPVRISPAGDTAHRHTPRYPCISGQDELLSAVGKLTAEYGKIGGNLNQIARCLNEYGAPYNALSGEVRAAIADLAASSMKSYRK